MALRSWSGCARDVEVFDAGVDDVIDDRPARADIEQARAVGRQRAPLRRELGRELEDRGSAGILAGLAAGDRDRRCQRTQRMQRVLERVEIADVIGLDVALLRERTPTRGRTQLLDTEPTARVADLRAVDREVGVAVDARGAAPQLELSVAPAVLLGARSNAALLPRRHSGTNLRFTAAPAWPRTGR